MKGKEAAAAARRRAEAAEAALLDIREARRLEQDAHRAEVTALRAELGKAQGRLLTDVATMSAAAIDEVRREASEALAQHRRDTLDRAAAAFVLLNQEGLTWAVEDDIPTDIHRWTALAEALGAGEHLGALLAMSNPMNRRGRRTDAGRGHQLAAAAKSERVSAAIRQRVAEQT